MVGVGVVIEKLLAITVVFYIAYLYFYRCIPFEINNALYIFLIAALFIILLLPESYNSGFVLALITSVAIIYTLYLEKCKVSSESYDLEYNSDSPIGKAFNYN